MVLSVATVNEQDTKKYKKFQKNLHAANTKIFCWIFYKIITIKNSFQTEFSFGFF